MRKKKQRVLMTVWLLLIALSRLLYFFLMRDEIVDTYAYGANAIAGTGNTEAVLTSGLAYAYTQKLSGLLELFQNDFVWVLAYHTILQIVWLILVFLGVKFLWGEAAGYITSAVLMVLPFVIQSIKVIEPVNFLLFHFSIVLFLYGVLKQRTLKCGWYRSNIGELFLILLGFYTGVVCLWNYVGFLLVPIMVYVLIKNQSAMREKIWKQKNIDLEEKEQLMPAGSQGFILLSGLLVGMFATLMKYTGLTGLTVWMQFVWWEEQFAAFPGRCQDISFAVLVGVVAAFVLGIAGQYICVACQKTVMEKKEYKEILKREELERKGFEETKIEVAAQNKPEETEEELWWKFSEEEDDSWRFSDDEIEEEDLLETSTAYKKQKDEMEMETNVSMRNDAMQEEYFTTKDGRTVKYIENPLPGPKKHVKKEMNFAFDEVKAAEKKKDDFDFDISDGSDFDYH